MPPPKLSIVLPASILNKLRTQASTSGLTAEDLAAIVLGQYALTGGGAPTTSRPGRPLSAIDDLPADIERDASQSGFAGVKPFRHLWQANAGRTVIGRFSSAALAAFARHFLLRGFMVGRGVYFTERCGMDVASAVDYASRAGFGAVPQQIEMPSTVPGMPATGDKQADDPPPGPETDGGSRAALVDGGTAPSTSPGTIAQLGVLGQQVAQENVARGTVRTVRRRAPATEAVVLGLVGNGDVCPACDGAMDRAVERVNPQLCPPCSEAWVAWNALPAIGEYADAPPADGMYTLDGDAPAQETFVEYMRRVRGL